MFDIDLTLREAYSQSTQAQGARIAAILDVLIKKGVVTEQEMEQTIAIMETKVDQAVAESKNRQEPQGTANEIR